MRARILATLTSLLACLLAWSGDWPQWRGPEQDGTSKERNLPLEWAPDKNVAWKIPMPAAGGSTPIVWGDRIFLQVGLNLDRSDAIELWSLDRKDGGVRWKRRLAGANARTRKQDLSSPSPVTDGKVVVALTGTGLLRAFDFDGEELWMRNLQAEYGAFGLMWGYASSPLLHDGVVYVQVLHGTKTNDPSYLLSLDLGSGKTRWRVERPTQARRESPDAYSTPILYRHANRSELVISGGDAVTAHDPATGKELWRATVLNPTDDPSWRIVTTPLYAGGVVVASGKRAPLVGLEPGGSGEVKESRLLWSRDQSTDVPSPVSDGRRLFLVTDRGIAWCLDVTSGKAIWGPERLGGTSAYSASPVLADGRVYATSEDGVTTVLAAEPEFRVLARNELEGYVLSSLAVSDGQLFIRTSEYLWAIGKPHRSAAPAGIKE